MLYFQANNTQFMNNRWKRDRSSVQYHKCSDQGAQAVPGAGIKSECCNNFAVHSETMWYQGQ